ncbi:MAG: hypothetical protein V7761_07295 [Amylibacter sp.]
MCKTGGKTSTEKLGSLTLSAEHLVHVCPQLQATQNPPPTEKQNDNYIQRLKKEHGKVLNTPSSGTIYNTNDPVNLHENSVLKLKQHHMTPFLPSSPSLKIQENPIGLLSDIDPENSIKPQVNAATHDDLAHSSDTSVLKSYIKTTNVNFKRSMKEIHKRPVTKTVAPRALPFSKETHVRVKIISQEVNLEGNAPDPVATERFSWMQRDAIKHYLCIQNIERKRAATEGAVYKSFKHDA